MGDPVWLDTNVVASVANGNKPMEAELVRMRSEGRELLLVPAANNELLYGNPLKMKGDKPVTAQQPSPQTRTAIETIKTKLGIHVDYSADNYTTKDFSGIKDPKERAAAIRQDAMERRVGYAMQDHVKRPRNKAVPASLDNISESDSLVLSEIKASAESRGVKKPQIFTAETGQKGMISQTKVYGIEPLTLRSPPPSGGVPGAGGVGGGAASATSKINLADYPPERPGAISRFFKDRPVLTQIGLVGVGIAASAITSKMIDMVKSHFEGALDDAQAEFEKNFPDPASLAAAARIDQYRQSYEASLAKLRAPGAAKAFGATMVALTPAKDRAAALRYVQTQLSKVKLADGAIGGFGDAAQAYIDAMADLAGQLTKYRSAGLPDISADIGKRAALLQRVGDKLQETFETAASIPVPFADTVALDIYSHAQTVFGLSARMQGFSAAISGRAAGYDRLAESLDKDLMKVSEQINQYAP